MEFQHGGLKMQLPEDWTDRSTLVFVSPEGHRDLPVAQGVTLPAEVVTVQLVEGKGSPQDILEMQASQLTQMQITNEKLDEGPFECGLGEAWFRTQRMTAEGRPVRQLSVAARAAGLCVIAHATAVEERFGAVESQLRDILSSMRAAGGAA